MPWIVLTIISLIYDMIQIIGALVNLSAGDVVFGLLGFVVGFYIFIIVWSYRFVDNWTYLITFKVKRIQNILGPPSSVQLILKTQCFQETAPGKRLRSPGWKSLRELHVSKHLVQKRNFP